jgi:hypothetical protein
MSTNQSKDPATFSNLGRLYREVEELRLQVRQAESAGGFEETLLRRARHARHRRVSARLPRNPAELR